MFFRGATHFAVMKSDESWDRPVLLGSFARFVMDEAVSAKELPGNGLNFSVLPYKIKHGCRRKSVSVSLPYLRPARTWLRVLRRSAGAVIHMSFLKLTVAKTGELEPL